MIASGTQDYSVIVKRDLFHPLETVTVAPVKVVAPLPKPVIVQTGGWGHTAVRPVTPQAPQVAFTGVVDINGEHYALLESLEDHLSHYTRVGSTAFGYKLVAIGEKSVTVETNGESIELNIGDNKEEEDDRAGRGHARGDAASRRR